MNHSCLHIRTLLSCPSVVLILQLPMVTQAEYAYAAIMFVMAGSLTCFCTSVLQEFTVAAGPQADLPPPTPCLCIWFTASSQADLPPPTPCCIWFTDGSQADLPPTTPCCIWFADGSQTDLPPPTPCRCIWFTDSSQANLPPPTPCHCLWQGELLWEAKRRWSTSSMEHRGGPREREGGRGWSQFCKGNYDSLIFAARIIGFHDKY